MLVARDGDEVAEHVRTLTPERARAIGEAALRRVLAEHTYAHRAAQLEASCWTRSGCGMTRIEPAVAPLRCATTVESPSPGRSR